MAAHPEPAEEVILDVDATDDPLHGKQEGGVSPPKYSECLDFGVLPVTIAPNWFRVVSRHSLIEPHSAADSTTCSLTFPKFRPRQFRLDDGRRRGFLTETARHCFLEYRKNLYR